MASATSHGVALRRGLLLLPFGVAISDNVISVTTTTTATANEVVVVDRVSRRFVDYQKAEPVVMVSPYDPAVRIIRRVKGTEKEWVKVVDDDGEFMAFVPKGYIWCEGDDGASPADVDSRDFGPAPKGLIVGRPLARFLWRTSSPAAACPEQGQEQKKQEQEHAPGAGPGARTASAARHQDTPFTPFSAPYRADSTNSRAKIDPASVPSPDFCKPPPNPIESTAAAASATNQEASKSHS
jgi:hypothetical protein